MNRLNRVLAALTGLALAALGIGVVALTWLQPDDTLAWLRDAVDWLDRNDGDFERAVLTLLALLVAFASLALKLALAGAGLALLEAVLAKLRLFLAPEFLSTAFLLAVLGMLIHFLMQG